MVGKRSIDDEQYGEADDERKMYNKTSSHLMADGAQIMYGVIKSLDRIGVVQKVSFKLSSIREAIVDREYVDSLGWTDNDAENNGTIHYYNNQHFRFKIPYKTL